MCQATSRPRVAYHESLSLTVHTCTLKDVQHHLTQFGADAVTGDECGGGTAFGFSHRGLLYQVRKVEDRKREREKNKQERIYNFVGVEYKLIFSINIM